MRVPLEWFIADEHRDGASVVLPVTRDVRNVADSGGSTALPAHFTPVRQIPDLAAVDRLPVATDGGL